MTVKLDNQTIYNSRQLGRISSIDENWIFMETIDGKSIYLSPKNILTPIAEGDIVTYVKDSSKYRDVVVSIGGFFYNNVWTKIPINCEVLSVIDYEEVQVMKRLIKRTWNEQKQNYRIFYNDDFRCKCCGRKAIYALNAAYGTQNHVWKFFTEEWSPLTVDHKIPTARGGTNHIDNYQTYCQICNQTKATQLDDEEITEQYTQRKLK